MYGFRCFPYKLIYEKCVVHCLVFFFKQLLLENPSCPIKSFTEVTKLENGVYLDSKNLHNNKNKKNKNTYIRLNID